MSTYNYSIANDTLNGQLYSPSLVEAIDQSSISVALDRIDSDGDNLSLVFTGNISAEEQTTLSGLVSNHDGQIPVGEKPLTKVEVVKQDQSPPFASKILPETGEKLFRRKHGVKKTIQANTFGVLTIVVPYVKVKIDKAEIINCKVGDTVDLHIHDTPQGHIQLSMGVPVESVVASAPLNQFGFGVCVPDGYYEDYSNYDADLIKDMEIRITYHNNSNEDITVGVNITLHEVV